METSKPVVLPETWTHVAGTYNSSLGKAAIYINGELSNEEPGSGLLSQVCHFFWNYEYLVFVVDWNVLSFRTKVNLNLN